MKKLLISLAALLVLSSSFALCVFADTSTAAPITTSAPSETTAKAPSTVAPQTKISAALSPAVDIIAANSPMAKAGISGNTIAFSKDDFARAMNLSRVDSITVVSVTASTDGVLLLGNTAVANGQSISRDNIALLTFDPVSETSGKTSFSVCVNDSTYSIECSLYMLDSPNANPTVDMTAETMLSVNGYSDTAVFGKLGAYDPEGDALTYQIVELPRHGLVIMNDRTCGKYTYLPENGYTGRDGFSYVVYDKYGNYSSSATVSLNISEPATSVIYSDMIGNTACCAAISMTEKGIMNGTQVGSICYFYPNSEVSRAEFLVMAMNAAGIKELPASAKTDFFDESSISASAVPYVAAAKQLGYIEGKADANGNLCFYPDEKITRAEAALIVDRIMNGASYLKQHGSAAPVFSDASDIPDWAQGSVETLARLGVIRDDAGRINANSAIRKGETAMMLDLMMQVMDK